MLAFDRPIAPSLDRRASVMSATRRGVASPYLLRCGARGSRPRPCQSSTYQCERFRTSSSTIGYLSPVEFEMQAGLAQAGVSQTGSNIRFPAYEARQSYMDHASLSRPFFRYLPLDRVFAKKIPMLPIEGCAPDHTNSTAFRIVSSDTVRRPRF